MLFHILGTQNYWQELIESDVLHHSTNNPPGFFVERFPFPVRINLKEFLLNAVVFSHPQGVQNSECGLLVHSLVAGSEARLAILQLVASFVLKGGGQQILQPLVLWMMTLKKLTSA